MSIIFPLIVFSASLVAAESPGAESLVWDRIYFGDAHSEALHDVRSAPWASDTTTGGLGEPCRRILPPENPTWTTKDSLVFTIKVHPERVNYLTFKFWGGDVPRNHLILYIDGKQLGYRHLGDYDILAHPEKDAPCPGQFYFVTTALPESVTSGKESLTFEIRMTGWIWRYGQNFEIFQREIEGPSHGIYAAYTHAAPFFEPTGEKEGAMVRNPPTRTAPGEEVLVEVKKRVDRELVRILRLTRATTQQEIEFFARGVETKWTSVYQNSRLVEMLVESFDAFVEAWRQNPQVATNDPRQYNGDWFGVAPLAEALCIAHRKEGESLQKLMDAPLTLPDGTPSTRRHVWGDLLSASLQFLTTHRRPYTNQTMIIDWNIYRVNQALRVVDASRALPEDHARRYLYESLGLAPWLGSETSDGPEKPMGESYRVFSPKGLSRELGYVGNYGEILDWACLIYAACPDEEIRRQIIRLESARSWFRVPSVDAEGNRAMRLLQSIGWRDVGICGSVLYASRTGKEGDALAVSCVTRTPESLAAAKQMLRDNQYFLQVQKLLGEGGLRVSNVLLKIPEQYDFIKSELAALEHSDSQPPRGLPTSVGSPDFVFSDETTGVVALKNGDELLYVSLYWRANFGINFLSKIHYITPERQQVAVVRNRTEFSPGGCEYVRENRTNFAFRPDYGIHYPEKIDSLHAGERLPIARVPESIVDFRPGRESVYAGFGSFYELHFGKYFIVMNTTSDQTFATDLPQPGQDLATGTRSPRTRVEIPPQTTRVWVLDHELKVE
ncbi:MAG: hypothetical protein Q4D38_14835 [Planctomycetia bacterium]|nr:hypothetical protein [Planctomycetia bacterium]